MVTLERSETKASCQTNWDDMDGTPKVRYCESCQQHVYNFAGLSLPEIEALVEHYDGPGTVTIYTRTDGTFMTAERPRSLCSLRERVTATTAVAVGCLLGLLAGGVQTQVAALQRASVPTTQIRTFPTDNPTTSGFTVDDPAQALKASMYHRHSRCSHARPNNYGTHPDHEIQV